MKVRIRPFLLLVTLLLGLASFAQTTCETALPFCAAGVSGVTFPASVNQPPAQSGPDYGCLFTQPNPAWYYLQISQAGNLDILIQGTITSPPGPGQDVDFICWGPFSSLAGICNSLTASFSVDCSYSGSFTETLNIPNGQVGEYYIVLITNFANVQQNIVFTQYAGTGATNCALLSAASSSICSGSTGTIVANNVSNLQNPTYSIQPGGLTNNTGTFVLSPAVTTSYTLYVTGQNSQSVVTTNTAVATITVNPLPVVAPTSTQATCTNSNNVMNIGLSFNPPTAAPNYTVAWSPVPAGLSSPTQVIVNNSAPGVYAASVTVAGGCQAVANFTMLPQPGIPSFTLLPASMIYSVTCANPTVYINASDPSLNYFWTNGLSAPINGIQAGMNNLSLGTWSVTGTDPVSTCLKTYTFQVVQDVTPPTSTITPVSQLISCTNTAIQTVTGNASPNTNILHEFLWSYGGSASSNATTAIVVPGAGTHTYMVTNLLNGCKVTKTFTVATSSGVPTFNLASPVQNFSIGCVPKHVADVIIQNGNTNPPGGTVDYNIYPATFTGTPSFTAANTYTLNQPGNYIAYIRDIVSGCVTKTQFSIIQNTVEPDQVVNIPTQTLTCFTPTILMTGLSSVTAPGYQWIYSGGTGTLVSPGPNFTTGVTPSETSTNVATYTFQVTDPNNACFSRSVIPIYQNIITPLARITGPNASAAAAITCGTAAVILQNASTTRVSSPPFPTPGQLIIAREWRGPSPQPDLQNSSTYTAEIPGTYSMTVQDMNNGCYSSTVFTVGDNRDYPLANNPLAAPYATLDCSPNPLSAATVSVYITSTVNLIYQWYSLVSGAYPIRNYQGSSGTSTGVATENVTDGPGEYYVIITNTVNGCEVKATSFVVNGALYSRFNSSDTSGFAPHTVTFNNVSTSSINNSSITSVWNFGNGSTQTVSANNLAQPVTQIYNQPGNYTVTLYVSKGQCFDTETQVIHVEVPSKLEVPNVFTPNGDGSNDLFFVRMASLNEINLRVYDRWGNLVYEVLNSKNGNVEWDGTNLYGKDCAEGTYYYTVTASGKDGKVYDSKGTISLFR